MRTATVAAWLVIAAAGNVFAQGTQPVKPPQPSTAPAGGAVRHGAAGAPAPSVNPAPPKPSPPPTPPRPSPRGRSEPPRVSPPPSGAVPPGRTPFDAGPFTYAPRYGTSPRPRPPYYRGPGYSGYTIPYELAPPQPPGDPSPPADDQLSLSGVLELEVEPRSADIYVDGFYVGTADDVARNGLVLRSGRHWVEARAAGYDTLTVPVNITVGQFVRYRRELAPATAPVSSAPPAGPQTIYVIPGCFAGNRPPIESALPRGCDIANLRVIPQ